MTQTPHDALFRETFSRPSRAMSLVKAAFAPEVLRHLDTGSAALAPGTFIDAELRSRHSDLLFRVRLSGREAFAYLLLEHQSTSDPLMPYRMLRYMLGLWERWMKDHPAATKLPVILPLVVSHDPKGWRGAATLGAVYDLAAETLADLEPWVPMFHLAVDDLSAKDDAELRGRAEDALTQLVLLALKHARTTDDIEQVLVEWRDLLRRLARTRSGVEALATVMRYLYLVSQLEMEEAVRIIEAERMGEMVKEAARTGGEKLIERGRQEGFGNALLVLLRSRFGEVPLRARETIDAASIADIERWIAGAQTARSVDELLAS